MKKTAKNAKIRHSEFRIPKPQPPPQNRRKITITDEAESEAEIRELQQEMRELQKKVKELEILERSRLRFSITDDDETTKQIERNSHPQKRQSLPIPPKKRNSHPQKRQSLPIQLQRNPLPMIEEHIGCRYCKKKHSKSGEYCSDLCELGDVLGVPVDKPVAKTNKVAR
jgi:hypothetical protein